VKAGSRKGTDEESRQSEVNIYTSSIHESQLNTRRKSGIKVPKAKEEVNTLHPCSPVVVTVNF
jgi:hypothetical protein